MCHRHPPQRDAHDEGRAGGGEGAAEAEADLLRPNAEVVGEHRQGNPHRGLPGVHASFPGKLRLNEMRNCSRNLEKCCVI